MNRSNIHRNNYHYPIDQSILNKIPIEKGRNLSNIGRRQRRQQQQQHMSPSFEEIYNIDECINEGTYGTVYKAYRKGKNENQEAAAVAVKIIIRINDKNDRKVIKEVSMLQKLSSGGDGSNNVVQLIDFFMDEHKMYIVTNLAPYGDIIDELNDGRGFYNENDAKNIIRTLLKTVRMLHIDRRIVHRDIKPDNLLLLQNDDSYSSVQLCDFGFATYLPEPKNEQNGSSSSSDNNNNNKPLSLQCGSLAYTAPEIVNGENYCEQVDMWSIGCTLFLFLSGYHAFEAVDENDDNDDDSSLHSETLQNIRTCSYCMTDDAIWDTISNEAKELVTNLLVLDPNHRWTVDQDLKCDWIMNKTKTETTTNLEEISSSDTKNEPTTIVVSSTKAKEPFAMKDYSVLSMIKRALHYTLWGVAVTTVLFVTK